MPSSVDVDGESGDRVECVFGVSRWWPVSARSRRTLLLVRSVPVARRRETRALVANTMSISGQTIQRNPGMYNIIFATEETIRHGVRTP